MVPFLLQLQLKWRHFPVEDLVSISLNLLRYCVSNKMIVCYSVLSPFMEDWYTPDVQSWLIAWHPISVRSCCSHIIVKSVGHKMIPSLKNWIEKQYIFMLIFCPVGLKPRMETFRRENQPPVICADNYCMYL